MKLCHRRETGRATVGFSAYASNARPTLRSREHCSRVLAVVIGAWMVSSVAACSAFSSTLPPSTPDQRTAKAAKTCGSIAYPLVDTTAVILGAGWVAHANKLEEDSTSKTYRVNWDGSSTLESQGPPAADYGPLRIAGYVAMGVFGASSIYGYYASIQCANWRHEIAVRNRPSAAAAPTVLANPPKGVGGFTFDMTQAEAEQTCAANKQAWRLEGSVALCSSSADSSTTPPVRLEFQAGELHRMILIRRPSEEQLAENYDEAYASLRTTYGPPQVDRAALVGSCSGGLAQCMKNGEKPRGPVWSWPALTIELQPVWQDDRAVLEERYTHREELRP